MKQLIGVNDYKKLMNFEIKKTCAFCQLSGKDCDVSHFAPSETIKDKELLPFELSEDEHREVVAALNSLNLIDSESRNE